MPSKALTWMIGAADVLAEVLMERKRQVDKWGIRNYPDRPACLPQHLDTHTMLGIISAKAAREACDIVHNAGHQSHPHILIEEVAEAMAELDDPEKLRAELMQVAAVCVDWIEMIDRRKAGTVTA